jgi:hypothetical protein
MMQAKRQILSEATMKYIKSTIVEPSQPFIDMSLLVEQQQQSSAGS